VIEVPNAASMKALVQAGGAQRRFLVDVIVDGVRQIAGYPLRSAELKWDGGAKVRCQGRAVFEYSDELGRSVVPEDLTSWLTPYATYLNVYVQLSAGRASQKILVAYLKLVGVADPVDERRTVQGRSISIGSRVTLTLADAFTVTDRERFPAPTGPSDLTSTWAEIARVTNLPVVRNVADAAITRAVTYKENRLDAVFDLAAILGGRPYINETGQVQLESDVWPAASEKLTIGPEGTIIAAGPAALTDETVYNQVIVRSFTEGQDQVILDDTVKVSEGPLRWGGPFGRIPYFASSQFVTTYEQAHDYAVSLLPKVSKQPAVTFTIQCLPDPRRQVGDVVPFTWNGVPRVGRIREMQLAASGPMTLKVLVQNA
jgi:hypothetical protein